MKELFTFFIIAIAISSSFMCGVMYGDHETRELKISKEVCIDSGLVIYKGSKCTTEEWAKEQANKLIEK